MFHDAAGSLLGGFHIGTRVVLRATIPRFVPTAPTLRSTTPRSTAGFAVDRYAAPGPGATAEPADSSDIPASSAVIGPMRTSFPGSMRRAFDRERDGPGTLEEIGTQWPTLSGPPATADGQ